MGSMDATVTMGLQEHRDLGVRGEPRVCKALRVLRALGVSPVILGLKDLKGVLVGRDPMV
jgi:hypothetical protein